MVQRISGHDAELKDPESEGLRAAEVRQERSCARAPPEFLVLIGTCTHLGCLPKQHFDAGASCDPSWPGGFFCPCHGSRFDLAGRVFDGSPASMNLRIPPYSYPNPHDAARRGG